MNDNDKDRRSEVVPMSKLLKNRRVTQRRSGYTRRGPNRKNLFGSLESKGRRKKDV